MATISISGSAIGNELQDILMSDAIVPGAKPSYQLCKTIYLFHPLGAKMAESPIKAAQSKKRKITIPDGPEERCQEAFETEWEAISATKHIFNFARLSRIYGLASMVVMAEGVPLDRPIDYKKLSELSISFNVYDPLNTSGSLVLNQNTDAMDFQKITGISVAGKPVHRSRALVIMNEEPIYISYTPSAFGFVGRSVYQRALFPLKTYIQTLLTDDLVTVKAGVLIAKMAQPGSIIDNVMGKLFGVKRQLLKDAATGNVISVGPDDAVESLNFQNLHAPYELVRKNVLKNIATSADMPAVLIENETLTEGFGEGTEDAKIIAKYIEGIREWIDPAYKFFDKIVRYRAWNEEFYKGIQKDFPEEYGNVPYVVAFYRWSNSFSAVWPSLLEEPESEQAKLEKVKFDTVTDVLKELVQHVDPENKAILIKWAADNLNQNKHLFSEPLELDFDALREYVPPEQQMLEAGGDEDEDGEGDKGEKPGAKKPPVPAKRADAEAPWYAIEMAYGSAKLKPFNSRQEAVDYLMGTYGSMKMKRMGRAFEYGGRHLVARKSDLADLGYDD